ncbi:aminoglycoside phosphotransferase family protein [Aliiroseovarius sp. PrR006]|uniref:aminoglycoside phosphotransferase family protein n=1 Tax=Aliiroseovarius sp. PrR006 TaxID=2706883 RepID=UPI0013D71D4D|nr:phosphotransferase [Aliiroseovarius sp. PrR006]NDW54337.1 phosphotransferase [Aliiroseovarius sp. PrR006]
MSDDRAQDRHLFLTATGWADAPFLPLTGDASSRRYFRAQGAHPAILMDAPPSTCGSMRSFVDIARYLAGLGLSAPKIYAADLQSGFLLLEDFGDDDFASLINRDASLENSLYSGAIDVIHTVLDATPAPVVTYGISEMAQACDLAFLHYTPQSTTAMNEALGAIEDALTPFDTTLRTSLRDFHAQNLHWLPKRDGTACVGLLDFQDAVNTLPSYDLVSLLRDVRRDVSDDLAGLARQAFAKRRGLDQTAFQDEFHLVAVQRNLRILGIFARLSQQMDKPHYVDLIPRVWTLLQADLHHPPLAKLRAQLNAILPEPSPAHLERLRQSCPTQ